jgi:hypothetical protein
MNCTLMRLFAGALLIIVSVVRAADSAATPPQPLTIMT